MVPQTPTILKIIAKFEFLKCVVRGWSRGSLILKIVHFLITSSHNNKLIIFQFNRQKSEPVRVANEYMKVFHRNPSQHTRMLYNTIFH